MPASSGDASCSAKTGGVPADDLQAANAATARGPWFGPDPPAGGFVNPAPSVFGQTLDGPMPGHNPSMPWHYDLHVWLWADNLSGLFPPINPS